MVGEVDHSGGVTLSSIALLQERFRQLEKMKELRQEKELLRMLSESERFNDQSKHSKETCLGFDSKMMLVPPKPQCQLFLSLWPDSPIKNDGIIHQAPSNVAKSWFCDAPLVSTKIEKSYADIDTSLRL